MIDRLGALGHVGGATVAGWWLAATALIVLALVARHEWVLRQQFSAASAGRSVGAAVAIACLGAVLLPAAVGAGQATDGLPDLISDPPRPAFLKEIVDADGSPRLVVTFDGYIHNIGDGPLDVVGNPQLDGGMVQRVREGGEWRDVSTPTVRYETDDGHNHFHLIEAVDYVLWNEDQGAQTAAGSKIGFCLVDSEQIEPGADQAYSEELDDFCQEDNPTATELRMGISPGWRDIYDATTTLQWVDVSDMAPGRYWIGAITDPNDEIVESDEDNNALVFSDRPAVVPGWRALPTDVVSDGSPTAIEFDVRAFGTVGPASYTVIEGPTAGSLDVPIGAAIHDPVIVYTPDRGATGPDRIVFSVRDESSPYPAVAPTAEIRIEVAQAGVGQPAPGNEPTLLTESTFFEMSVGEPFESPIATLSATGTPVRVHAIGLPSGLRIDGDRLAGAAVTPGFTDVELVGVDENGGRTSQMVTIIVNPADDAVLAAGVDRSSPLAQAVRVQLGRPSLGASYEATGLPPGLELDEAAPVVTGTPSETGMWQVEVTQVSDDGTTSTAGFKWTVRPAVTINFAL